MSVCAEGRGKRSVSFSVRISPMRNIRKIRNRRNLMRQSGATKTVFLLLSMIVGALVSGCGVSATYAYRAITENCNCEQFRARDRKNRIDYLFHAQYRMDGGIVTS